jgi:hypothetical protein
MVPHSMPEEDSALIIWLSALSASGLGAQGAWGRTISYPAIKMDFWQDEKSCHFLPNARR